MSGNTSTTSNDKAFTVYCRFRPLNKRELNLGETKEDAVIKIDDDGKSVTLAKHTFAFDRVVGEEVQQEQFYNDYFHHEVCSFLNDRFDLSVITYGQTSSGKTWSIDGNFYDNVHAPGGKYWGILPRSLNTICELANDLLELSYYEIYRDNVVDLLLPTNENAPKIRFFENIQLGGLEMLGLTWCKVKSFNDVKGLLLQARKARHFASTDMNSTSSRSHTVLDIRYTKRGEKRAKHLRLIDLAGSERINKTNATGMTLKEGIDINRSLLYLRQLIESMAKPKKSGGDCSAARASKLTRLLYYSIKQGRAKVILTLCCSPAANNVNETLKTLDFGSLAKTVSIERPEESNVSVEEVGESKRSKEMIAIYEAKIRDYEENLEQLRIKLADREVESLEKRVQKYEEAFSHCLETIRLQEEIITSNMHDIMEMRNDLNFYEKFRKHLIDSLDDDDDDEVVEDEDGAEMMMERLDMAFK